jgi:hypothetical protein
MPYQTQSARSDHALACLARAQRCGNTGRLRGWTGLPGRGPAGLSGRPRVAGRRAVHRSRGPDSSRHCAAGLNRF